MNNIYTRTVRDFVEDLLSSGRSAKQVLIVAENSRWKTSLIEVKQVLSTFSGKLSRKILIY